MGFRYSLSSSLARGLLQKASTASSRSSISVLCILSLIHISSSVVKELVENAMDAGARAVTVEIKEGGCSFIRVTDNGGGIEKEQVRKAFFRHATSKIRTVEEDVYKRQVLYIG